MTVAPISIRRGDTWGPATSPITDEDTGEPYDFTGATVTMTIKRRNDYSDDDSDALIALTVGDGITVDDPDPGDLTVEISDEETETLEAETVYRYDVQIEKGGKKRTVLGGLVVVSRDTTRA